MELDMSGADFRRHAQRLTDWIADYLENSERYPVMHQVRPGQIRDALPAAPPSQGEPMDAILDDFENILVPGLTHWNHPRFFAYFAISASAPGVLAEYLCAALNQQAMLWRTSPAATELEEVTLDWVRQLMGLAEGFEGVIYDTASVATLHALAAAREATAPEMRFEGAVGAPLTFYCSDQVHSSIDKAVILLGAGLNNLRKIPTDEGFRMIPEELERALTADRAAGKRPCAVVATVGTTSTTSIDPVPAIAEICRRHGVWLHVDAAYGGAAALAPEFRHYLDGCDQADSLVVNPHKWFFVPFDLSALYCRRMDTLRQAFSLVAAYLKTSEGDQVNNLMDTGIQLGRRFRALKLWFVLRTFGAEGMAARIRGHIALAREFASWVDEHPDFERTAPVPMSLVCFRFNPGGLSEEELADANLRLMEELNRSGTLFLSQTVLRGKFTLRLAVGNLRTTRDHLVEAWEAVQAALGAARP